MGRRWAGRSCRGVLVVLAFMPPLFVSAATTTYTYDALGRLRETVSTNGTQTVYTLDPAGNRSNTQDFVRPSLPGDLSLPATSTTGVYTVSWGSATGDVTAYELFFATTSTYVGEQRIYGGTNTSVQETRGDGSFYYRVRACNGKVCSGYKTGAITVLRVPGQPGTLSASPNPVGVNASYTLSWGPASGAITRYELYRSTSPDFGQLLPYTTSATSMSFPGPHTAGSYFFRVRACNDSGCGLYNTNVVSLTITAPPAPPTNLVRSLVSFCTWQATWSASAGATSYRLTDTWGTVQTVTGTNGGVVWSATCPPPAGVTPESRKPMDVAACNLGGCSARVPF
jgi:YD repeat-containing protein